MTKIKSFVPDPVRGKKSTFLSNTSNADAIVIVRVFKDVCIGEPKPYNGVTVKELHDAGIVGLYEGETNEV